MASSSSQQQAGYPQQVGNEDGVGAYLCLSPPLASSLQVLEALWGWDWLLVQQSCSLLLWEPWLPAGHTATLSELCSQCFSF